MLKFFSYHSPPSVHDQQSSAIAWRHTRHGSHLGVANMPSRGQVHKNPPKNETVTGECGLTGIQGAIAIFGLCSPIPPEFWSIAVRFSSLWATEWCTAWDKVWRRRKRDSCSKKMATWRRNDLVQGRHAFSCFALLYGRRRRWCGKITCVKETNSYTVREFHTFWINSFREKKWDITFWATLVHMT